MANPEAHSWYICLVGRILGATGSLKYGVKEPILPNSYVHMRILHHGVLGA